jgi:L-histidine N-alpha-methyltransferase
MRGANVFIHASQFPERVRADLLQSLRARQINHKFHYDSYKQAQKWMALHEAYSPARSDADCLRIYDEIFAAAAKRLVSDVHLIGLGCGGGQKEAALLRLMVRQGNQVAYSPSDVSLPLVLTAHKVGVEIIGDDSSPVVCDLAEMDDLEEAFGSSGTARRVVTFFGMIPNFAPDVILPKLTSLLRSGDLLLFSANLAPGGDYAAGVEKILPQYQNELTADWLMTFLLDLGVERADGDLSFSIEETKLRFRRIVAHFEFAKDRDIRVAAETIRFAAGEKIRLFFSYRYQPEHIVRLLEEQGIVVLDQRITLSQEEGVFLATKC